MSLIADSPVPSPDELSEALIGHGKDTIITAKMPQTKKSPFTSPVSLRLGLETSVFCSTAMMLMLSDWLICLP